MERTSIKPEVSMTFFNYLNEMKAHLIEAHFIHPNIFVLLPDNIGPSIPHSNFIQGLIIVNPSLTPCMAWVDQYRRIEEVQSALFNRNFGLTEDPGLTFRHSLTTLHIEELSKMLEFTASGKGIQINPNGVKYFSRYASYFTKSSSPQFRIDI